MGVGRASIVPVLCASAYSWASDNGYSEFESILITLAVSVIASCLVFFTPLFAKNTERKIRVAGIQSENSDGVSRQEIISQLDKEHPVTFKRANSGDAVQVMVNVQGKPQQIGFIPRGHVDDMLKWLFWRKVSRGKVDEIFEINGFQHVKISFMLRV